MSSILEGIVRWTEDGIDWKLIHMSGFFIGILLMELIWPERFEQEKHLNLSWWNYVIGGLLVGIGTRLGNGCTSGHGICGISRMSLRSVVAVVIFISMGMCASSILFLNGWGMTKERSEWDKQEGYVHFIITPFVILVAILYTLFRFNINFMIIDQIKRI